MSRNYNFIYSQLVKDEFDFVGQIAYSLYKKDKIKHIEEYNASKGHEIPQPELEKFHEMSCKEIVIEAYRRKAEDILEEFINETLEEATEEIKFNAINNHTEILKAIIKPITPASKMRQFWTRILQSIVSNLTLSAIIALIILILYVSRVGIIGAIENIYKVKLVPGTTRNN